MSHFAVAVISKHPEDVERLLAPYQENNMGDCPREFLEFVDAEREEKEVYETKFARRIQTPDGKLLSPWDKAFLKEEKEFGSTRDDYLIPPDCKEVLVSYKELYPTFEQYMRDCCGYNEPDPETGRFGYWENPNARWDYWLIGGRFRGLLKASRGYKADPSWEFLMGDGSLKPMDEPDRYDQAQIKDIDFTMDQALYDKAIRFWEVYVDGEPLKEGEDPEGMDSYYRPEYYRDFYGTKEAFAKERASFQPWAFVTPDEGWQQKGQMGWWATHDGSQESFQTFSEAWEHVLANIDPEYFITIVDCHI